jgi:hypothetical protein
MLRGAAKLAPTGIKGFDTNVPISSNDARAFFNAKYRFAARYIPRVTARPNDLTTAEIDRLFSGGLAVSLVQHVESADAWTPTDDKGRQYGDVAGAYCKSLGVPAGVTVWLDLEGIALGVDAEQVIRYCNYWHDKVLTAGYEPGIYVGWRCVLTGEQLYKRLKFKRYWSAYNENSDQLPIVRGVCMSQHVARTGDKPNGIDYGIDTDLIAADRLGDLPTLYAPDEWSVQR